MGLGLPYHLHNNSKMRLQSLGASEDTSCSRNMMMIGRVERDSVQMSQGDMGKNCYMTG